MLVVRRIADATSVNRNKCVTCSSKHDATDGTNNVMASRHQLLATVASPGGHTVNVRANCMAGMNLNYNRHDAFQIRVFEFR
jgi:hypothetical protein